MRQIAALILIWFVAGYLIGAAVNQVGPVTFTPLQFGIAGLLVGLAGLAVVTRTEEGRRMFYEGPRGEELGDPLIGCLWLLPMSLGAIALVAWIVFSV